MRIGISKKRLDEILSKAIELEQSVETIELLQALTKGCTELDPLLPIDENTPKNIKLHLYYKSIGQVIEYYDPDERIMGTPTHYKLLSPITPTEQPNSSPKAPGAEISPSVV